MRSKRWRAPRTCGYLTRPATRALSAQLSRSPPYADRPWVYHLVPSGYQGRKLCYQRCGKLTVGSVPCFVSQRAAFTYAATRGAYKQKRHGCRDNACDETLDLAYARSTSLSRSQSCARRSATAGCRSATSTKQL